MTATRRAVLGALAGSGVAAVVGCAGRGSDGGSETPDSNGTLVETTDGLRFEPRRLSVSVGETVTWENVGSVPHSVTARGRKLPDGADYFASGGFDSEDAARDGWPKGEGRVGGGETYEHTFETAGEFPYFCIPHPNMTGAVVVEE